MKNNYQSPEIIFEIFAASDVITYSNMKEHSGDELDYSTL